MVANDNDEWTYLDMWGHRLEIDGETGIVEAVKEQINELVRIQKKIYSVF